MEAAGHHPGAAGLLGNGRRAAQGGHHFFDHRGRNPDAHAPHWHHELEGIAKGLPMGHCGAVCRRYRHGLCPAENAGCALAGQADCGKPGPGQRLGLCHPDAAVDVPDRDSHGLCQRLGAGLDHDPYRDQRAAGRGDPRH